MTHSAFEFLNQQRIETLDLTVEAYRHNKTGALHYHLQSSHDENVFMVAFRTLPQDSTGVAHILEHTALCGSMRFPVRDPFFMMVRRSLNTFMNAFTSSDWTAYPFATQNRKDFDHLLQVYLDAAFFALLDPLDFAQEGHRVEFSKPDDPNSALVFKGIVFNEMKGAMSSINSVLWQTLSQHLQPGTTYAHNSGGDPLAILDLTHAQLHAFYKRHYHPSNAIFMTYGNIPAHQHHLRFEALALQHFEKQAHPLRAQKQQRFSAIKKVEAYYPYNPEDSAQAENKNYILLSWLLGESSNLQDVLTAQLICGALLENSAAPLQHYLETTPLGSSPSALCGIDHSGREIIFSCGIEGAQAANADLFEQQVIALLQNIVRQGIDQTLVESVLHRLELHQREITGSSYPYGLSLMLSALPGALHDGDPIQLLDIDPILDTLRNQVRDPQFICQLIDTCLLQNTHRLRLLMRPNSALQAEHDTAEKQRLQTLAHTLQDSDKQKIVTQSLALQQRQQLIDDANILPKLQLADIPSARSYPQFDKIGERICFYAQPTNGLVYQDIRIALPALNTRQLELLPLLTSCLSELGVGDKSYLQVQQQQSAHSGGISAFYQIRNNTHQQPQAYWGISGKALAPKYQLLSELQLDCLQHVRFDELQRIRELVQQMRASAEDSITGSGHTLAILAASSSQLALAGLEHQLSGLLGIAALKALDEQLASPAHLKCFADELAALYQHILHGERHILLIGEQKQREHALAYLTQIDCGTGNPEIFRISNTFGKQQLWLTQTQVNFCAKVFPSVCYNHPDAPALTVLASLLRNGFLHRSIREQGGAYGGGASQDNHLGLFKFYSYRDPRLLETLEDFDASVQWFLSEQHSAQLLEEAILTVIASIDKPSSPAGEARKDYSSKLLGLSTEQQLRFRRDILNLDIDTLKRVAHSYLSEGSAHASSAMVSSEAQINASGIDWAARGFEIHSV